MSSPTHFQLSEFLHSDTANQIGADNYPTWEIAHNLERLAQTMELIRAGLGGYPVGVLSGYRCPEVNKAVGGATNSAHLYGLAVDFIVPDFGSPLDICRALEPHLRVLAIDQLIYEIDWVHLGLAISGEPRHQTMTISDAGTCEGF